MSESYGGGYSGESSYSGGYYSGGYSSESSYSSESRDSYDSYSYSSESASESRDFSEPKRTTSSYSSESASESRDTYYEDRSPVDMYSSGTATFNSTPTNTKTGKYNSLDDIDKLILQMEKETKDVRVSSEAGNAVLSQRKAKLLELKKLVAEARKAEAEAKLVEELELGNTELDEAIEFLRGGLHR